MQTLQKCQAALCFKMYIRTLQINHLMAPKEQLQQDTLLLA